jgi:hypothetical protein
VPFRRPRRPAAALVVAFLALSVALSGTSVAQEATLAAKKLITGEQIKDGSVQAKDLSAKARRKLRGAKGAVGPVGPAGDKGATGAIGPEGVPGPTFGESVNGNVTSVTGCGPSTVATMPITVTRPSRILASAAGAWDRNSTNLNTGTLVVQLVKDGTAVATSAQGFGTSFSTGTQRIHISVNAVLWAGTNPFATSAATYVAQPGAYELRAQAGASDGTCTGTSTLWRPFLTYALLGTTA